MITRDLWQLQSIETRRFVKIEWKSPGFAAGETPRPTRRWRELVEDPIEAEMWSRADLLRAIAEDALLIDRRLFRIVPAPRCGCCGLTECSWTPIAERSLRLVVDAIDVANQVWRCEKHVSRNPCCIEGCGKTFGHKGDTDGRGAEDYSWRMMCGHCWRQAPTWMRDAVARVRRIARRRGWTEQMCIRHGRLWERCHRAIREGRAAPALETNSETIVSSGPPPVALLQELERVGL